MMRSAMALLLLCLPCATGTAQGPAQLKDVAYKNLTLSYDPALAREYLAETVPAIPLLNKTDKPDGVWPEHIRITFRESYVPLKRREAGGEDAQVRIYVFPATDPNNKDFDKDFPTTRKAADNLAVYLARRSRPAGEMIPFLPWADAAQAFVGKRKFLRFRNGRGVLFLTQYGQEKAPLNNSQLVYTFQGLTDDNAWYVSALFPVIAPGLPPAPDLDDAALAERGYDRTVGQAAARLEKLPAKNFTPPLVMLESIVRSLKINSR